MRKAWDEKRKPAARAQGKERERSGAGFRSPGPRVAMHLRALSRGGARGSKTLHAPALASLSSASYLGGNRRGGVTTR